MRYVSGISVWILALCASAQEPQADAVQATPANPQQQVLEELTVTGERPLGVLRSELRDAEDALYAAFNELVEDPRFEISCEFQRPIGSLIHRRVCQPAYVRESQSQATRIAQDSITGASDPGILGFSANADSEIALLQQAMLEKMTETIQGNPDLMRLFLQYRETQARLEEALSE